MSTDAQKVAAKNKLLQAIIENLIKVNHRMTGTEQLRLLHIDGMKKIVEEARDLPDIVGDNTPAVLLARKEMDTDCAQTNAQATVTMWAMLEASIEDLLVTWLVHNPELLKSDEFKKITIPVGFLAEGIEDQMRRVVRALEEKHSARNQPDGERNIMATYEALFTTVGLKDEADAIDSALKKDLVEMNKIRNLLLHRAGVVDQDFIKICNWTHYKIGDQIQLDYETTHHYSSQAIRYTFVLLERLNGAFERF